MLRGAPGSGRSRLLREAAWSISRELDVLELCAPEARPVERLLERAWPTASAPRGVALALGGVLLLEAGFACFAEAAPRSLWLGLRSLSASAPHSRSACAGGGPNQHGD